MFIIRKCRLSGIYQGDRIQFEYKIYSGSEVSKRVAPFLFDRITIGTDITTKTVLLTFNHKNEP